MALCNCHRLLPTGAGATAQWTANGSSNAWTCTDSPEADYGDTKYLSVTSAAKIHLFTIADPRPKTCGPKKVEVFARVKDPSSTAEAIKLGLRIGSTNYWSANKLTNNTGSYLEHRNEWTTNPATGGAWTWDDIATMQFGIQSINVAGGYAGAPRCSQLQLIVYCDSR